MSDWQCLVLAQSQLKISCPSTIPVSSEMSLVLALREPSLQSLLLPLFLIDNRITTLRNLQLVLEKTQDDFEEDPIPGVDERLSRASAALSRAVTMLYAERLRRVVTLQYALAHFHRVHSRFPPVSLE